MKQYNFILAYDIADSKRLRKIAKIVEKEAIRIQFSIFLLPKFTKPELLELLDKILKIYNENEDDIRIYKIKNKGINIASGVDLDQPFNFI